MATTCIEPYHTTHLRTAVYISFTDRFLIVDNISGGDHHENIFSGYSATHSNACPKR